MMTEKATALDRLLAAQASPATIAREIIGEARAGLEQFCEIPEGYRHCQLAHTSCDLDHLSPAETKALVENPPGQIVNPKQAHLEAIEFFRMILEGDPLVCDDRDALRPTVGAYLVGPPGVGKTHILAAFGRLIHEQLDKELGRMESAVRHMVEKLYEETLSQQAEWSRQPGTADNRWVLSSSKPMPAPAEKAGDDVLKRAMEADVRSTKLLPPEERFAGAVEVLRRRVREYPYQPTDLLYLGFDDLFEELRRDKDRRATMFTAIERSRIVFIDDIHPKGDPERIRVIQQLIERRYELDRPGTFLTTNLTADELGAGDRTVAQRLLSRCSENFIKFSFSDCTDWRMEVKARRIKLIEQTIHERLTKRA